MTVLLKTPEDRFSRNEAQIYTLTRIHCYIVRFKIRLRECAGWSVPVLLKKPTEDRFPRDEAHIYLLFHCSVQEITFGNPILVKSDIAKCWCDLENKINPPNNVSMHLVKIHTL